MDDKKDATVIVFDTGAEEENQGCCVNGCCPINWEEGVKTNE